MNIAKPTSPKRRSSRIVVGVVVLAGIALLAGVFRVLWITVRYERAIADLRKHEEESARIARGDSTLFTSWTFRPWCDRLTGAVIDDRGINEETLDVLLSDSDLEFLSLDVNAEMKPRVLQLCMKPSLKHVLLYADGDRDSLLPNDFMFGKNVERISVRGVGYGSSFWQAIRQSDRQNLRSLWLHHGGMISNIPENMEVIEQLREFDISTLSKSVRIPEEFVKVILSSPRLEIVRMGGLGIVDDGIPEDLSNSNLQELSLIYNPLTNRSFDRIVKIPRLRSLDISLTEIDLSAEETTFPETLRRLRISDLRVSPSCIQHIVESTAIEFCSLKDAKLIGETNMLTTSCPGRSLKLVADFDVMTLLRNNYEHCRSVTITDDDWDED